MKCYQQVSADRESVSIAKERESLTLNRIELKYFSQPLKKNTCRHLTKIPYTGDVLTEAIDIPREKKIGSFN